MGRLKLSSELDLPEKPDPIGDHVAGFLVNWDKNVSRAMPPMIKNAARINYAAGVRDALNWVRSYNEENKPKEVKAEP